MKKRNKLISLLAAAVLGLSGCSLNNAAKVYDDESKIIENYNTYNLVHSKQSVRDNRLSGSAEKMEGMGTIWRFETSGDTEVSITYSIKVTSGKAKLMLIGPDDAITTLVECQADAEEKLESTDTIQVKKGKNRIKLIAGKDTKIEYKFTADKGSVTSFGS